MLLPLESVATLGRLKRYEEAETFYRKSLAYAEQNGNTKHLFLSNNDLGWLKEQLGDLDGALSFYAKALELAQQRGDLYDMSLINLNFAKIYRLKGQFDQGIKYAEQGLAAAKKGKMLYNQDFLYNELYLSHLALKNYQAALENLEQKNVLVDSMRSKDIAVEILKKEFQYNKEKDSLQVVQERLMKELEFEKELNQERSNRNIFIFLGLLALIIAISSLYRLRYVRKTQEVLKEKNRLIESEKEKAKASEKAKQQFLANMSHEIRTPMNAIKGMTNILLRREPKNQQVSYLHAIKESSSSLIVIINDILDIAKIEAGKIHLEAITFSLTDVVENVHTIMTLRSEEKGLLLKTDLERDIPATVIGDPTRLRQILLNLTSNAIKFTEKGMVTLHLETKELEAGKVMAQFCISDTGVGIGTDKLEKIFESFEQAYSDTTRKFGGTGLGLSISKKLTEIQNGNIWVESEKGKGSKFYVAIPFALATDESEASVQAIAAENKHIASQLKGIKILLAEDNNFNAIVAREELEDAIEEVEVVVAENGAIAVEQTAHGDFDVVLMDVQMPVMNGYEATEKIRELTNGKADIPIIAMSANVMEDEVQRCYAAGMNEFIGKPFEVEELLRKIQSF